MKTLAPKARPLACALTLALLATGCQVRTAQPDRPGAAVALAVAAVALGPNSNPTPAPDTVGCAGGCNDTGWTGDGTVMYPCLVCNKDGSKPRPRGADTTPEPEPPAIDPNKVDPETLSLVEAVQLIALYKEPIWKTFDKLEEGATLIDAVKQWLKTRKPEAPMPTANPTTGYEKFQNALNTAEGKDVLIIVYRNKQSLKLISINLVKKYSLCLLEADKPWDDEKTNAEQFSNHWIYVYSRAGTDPRVKPVNLEELKETK